MPTLRAAGAAAALALAVDAAPPRVKHIVVLQMENHSFDNMLGWLSQNNSQIDGFNATNYHAFTNPLDPSDPSSPIFTVTEEGAYVDPDPYHSVAQTAIQLWGSVAASLNTSGSDRVPPMSGFVHSYAGATNNSFAPQIMAGLAPESVPVIATLAMEFALFDRFFAALPGPTYPNRLFTYAATSAGYGDNPFNVTVEGWKNQCIMEALDKVGGGDGKTSPGWRVYQEEVSTALLWDYTRPHLLDGHFRPYSQFATDAAAGELPLGLTIIDPAYFSIPGMTASDQHPNHDVVNGEKLIKATYEALRASPQWNESALIIVWDEHGGFYDHVPPPHKGVPNPDGIPCVSGCGGTDFNFTALGVRIPAVVVSPWIPARTVVHAPPEDVKPFPTSEFELSSLPATMHKAFGTADFLTARDAWAAPLNFLWDSSPLTEPRTDCPMTLPDPPAASPSLAGDYDKLFGNVPLSHLQEDLLTLAHGVLGYFGTEEEVKAYHAAQGHDTEAEVGLWIRQHMGRKLLAGKSTGGVPGGAVAGKPALSMDAMWDAMTTRRAKQLAEAGAAEGAGGAREAGDFALPEVN